MGARQRRLRASAPRLRLPGGQLPRAQLPRATLPRATLLGTLLPGVLWRRSPSLAMKCTSAPPLGQVWRAPSCNLPTAHAMERCPQMVVSPVATCTGSLVRRRLARLLCPPLERCPAWTITTRVSTLRLTRLLLNWRGAWTSRHWLRSRGCGRASPDQSARDGTNTGGISFDSRAASCRSHDRKWATPLVSRRWAG